MKKIYCLLISMTFIYSCTNHSEIDLTNPIQTGTTKYSTDIKSIIDNNCISCHGAVPQFGAPMSLTTASAVKEAIENRNLIGKISRPDGAAGLMPYGGPRLPQNTIDKIIDWKASGYLD